MALVKKQMTWFKKDSEISWFNVGTDAGAVEKHINKVIASTN